LQPPTRFRVTPPLLVAIAPIHSILHGHSRRMR
jgi:hypothetical protein